PAGRRVAATACRARPRPTPRLTEVGRQTEIRFGVQGVRRWYGRGVTTSRGETAGQGFEPQLPDSESGVLPLDDPARIGAQCSRALARSCERKRPAQPAKTGSRLGGARWPRACTSRL